ncbi:hypothetical protein MBLNU230_g6144t1 [Neophaeotheca triangularis]
MSPKPLPIQDIALKMATQGPHKTLPTPRLVQIVFAHTYIARTTSALYVWEHPYYPQFYLPTSAFPNFDSIFTPQTPITHPTTGAVLATQLKLTLGSRTTTEIIHFAADLSGAAAPLADLVKISFAAVDQWLEESTPIHVHPKDPFKRIDILHSTRPIKVSIAGRTIAESSSAMHLYETGLPARFYLPLTAVDVGVLRRTETRTQCPYKGEAEYYSVDLRGEGGERWEDVVWFYDRPALECAKVEGLCCFYNEKVDIELDGEMLARPDTPFGKVQGGQKPPLS